MLLSTVETTFESQQTQLGCTRVFDLMSFLHVISLLSEFLFFLFDVAPEMH